MPKRTVLSERKTKAAAALAGMTLDYINEQAGLGVAYISRKWATDKIELETINRIASVIGCSVVDLLEEVDADAMPPIRRRRGEEAPAAPASARKQQRNAAAALQP